MSVIVAQGDMELKPTATCSLLALESHLALDSSNAGQLISFVMHNVSMNCLLRLCNPP
jgi:hypothetical protein